MIIWISSYPKSGNTWIRFFIISLLLGTKEKIGLKLLENIQQFPNKSQYDRLKITDLNYKNLNHISKYWITAQNLINLDKRIRFFKTHNALCKVDNNIFTNEENTLGAIHIVRDPRNVITSLNNHYHHNNFNDSKNFIFDERKGIFNKSKIKANYALPQIIGSWRTHYLSWKILKKNYLLIKYENLVEKPNYEFRKIADYLEILLKKKFSDNQVFEAVKFSSFENLKSMEEKDGFSESVVNPKTKKREKFFYLGPKNDWKNILINNISNEICEKFKKEMLELGYL